MRYRGLPVLGMGIAGARGVTYRGGHLSTRDRKDARVEQAGELWSCHLSKLHRPPIGAGLAGWCQEEERTRARRAEKRVVRRAACRPKVVRSTKGVKGLGNLKVEN
jgi:hypothetical protein